MSDKNIPDGKDYQPDPDKTILLYVSHYKDKYYVNDKLGKLPESIKKELVMNMIFMAEEAGGVVELCFYPDGEVYIDTYCEEDDMEYDQVSGRLLVSEMEQKDKDVLDDLQIWYLEIMREKGRQ